MPRRIQILVVLDNPIVQNAACPLPFEGLSRLGKLARAYESQLAENLGF